MSESEVGQPLPFKEELESYKSQKFYNSGNFNFNLFGLPDGVSGLNRRNQLVWNKNGVALAYMLVPTLKSAVDVIAQNLSSVPMTLKDEKGNIVSRSDASGSSNSKFLNAIERSYSYYGVPLFELWADSILLYGECVIEKVPTTTDYIVGLKWLNPLATYVQTEQVFDNSEVIYANGKPIPKVVKTFRYSGSYGIAEYTEDEVLYSRAFNPVDDFRGYSSALNALSKANITIEFDNFTLAFYANNGHPGVIISPRDKLVGEGQVAEWQRQWQEKYRGSNQQFKTHISSFPFDVETFPILDVSKPLEVSKNAETQILRALRVQPEMIGDTTENSYQFSKESKNAFMQTVVRPLALSISNCINHSTIISDISPEEGNYKFGFDFSEFENIAKTDIDKQQVLENQVKSGGISIGQYQRSLGKDVVEGADDTYLIPQGFMVVKKEDLVNPINMQQPNDQTGPDTNTIQQKPRETQSVTEEQETTEFFGSKSYDPVELCSYLKVNHEKIEQIQKQVVDLNFEFSTKVQESELFHITTTYSESFPKNNIKDVYVKFNRFLVETDGLDYFDTPYGKAVYIKIKHNEQLDTLQKELFEEVTKYTNEISDFSVPKNYNPHITLGYFDEINDLPAIEDFTIEIDTIILSSEMNVEDKIIEPIQSSKSVQIPRKYINVDVVIPKGTNDFLKQHFQANIINDQISPMEIKTIHERFIKNHNDDWNDNDHAKTVSDWLISNVSIMDEADREETRKSISLFELQKIAKDNDISLEDTLRYLEEMEND